MQRGAEMAVADINAAGGVLGQQVRLITADDFCDPEQAVAAARKLVADGVVFVVGHFCSGASIPASEDLRGGGSPADLAGVEQPHADRTGPRQRLPRRCPRRCEGILAGNYLADHWADKKIAILHDSTALGKGWPMRRRSS